MDQELQQQIRSRMQELPADIRSIIQSDDFSQKIHAIGTRHALHIDQIGLLEDEVLLVLLAFSAPEDFIPSLVEQLNIDEATANIISDEVASEILLPVRESMQAFMEARSVKNIRDAASESLDVEQPPHKPLVPSAAPASRLPESRFGGADSVLTAKTITLPQSPEPKQTPQSTPDMGQKPQTQPTRGYSTDPYHEPIE